MDQFIEIQGHYILHSVQIPIQIVILLAFEVLQKPRTFVSIKTIGKSLTHSDVRDINCLGKCCLKLGSIMSNILPSNLDDLAPLTAKGLSLIQSIKAAWPPEDRLTSGPFRTSMMLEFDKYSKFLSEYSTALQEEHNKPANIIKRNKLKVNYNKRVECQFKKPLDPAKYGNTPISVVLNVTVIEFLEDAFALVSLYNELYANPARTPKESSVLNLLTERLAYFEKKFADNEPCMNFFINDFAVTLQRARTALAAPNIAPVNNGQPLDAEVSAQFAELITIDSEHQKSYEALKIFQKFLSKTQGNNAAALYTAENFERFLRKYSFFGNPAYDTQLVLGIDDVRQHFAEYEVEPSLKLKDFIQPSTFPVGSKGGSRKTRRSRRKSKKQRRRKATRKN